MRLVVFLSFLVTSLYAQQPVKQKMQADTIPKKGDTLRSLQKEETLKAVRKDTLKATKKRAAKKGAAKKRDTETAVQKDTLRATRKDTLGAVPERDTVKIKSYSNKFSPRRALLLAAILPGAGQIYTKKYWKTPLVWGGFGVLAWFGMANHNLHLKYRGELFDLLTYQTNNPSKTPPKTIYPYPEETLRHAVDRFRRDRDFTIILTGVWYLLQLVDAHVDAHLKEFKLNPELKLSYEPMIDSSPMTGQSAGLRLVLKF